MEVSKLLLLMQQLEKMYRRTGYSISMIGKSAIKVLPITNK